MITQFVKFEAIINGLKFNLNEGRQNLFVHSAGQKKT